MPDVNQLGQMLEESRAALATAKKVTSSDGGEAVRIAQEVSETAARLEEEVSSPIRVGIGGQFNSGKSLLIGSLIGWADTLPVEEIPTTGNATHIHFFQAPDLRETRVDAYRICYLDENGLRECLLDGLREAQQVVASNERGTVEKLLQGGAELWNDVVTWCERIWPQLYDGASQKLIREIYWLAGAYLRYRPLLRTEPYRVDTAMARAGLILPDRPTQPAVLSANDFFTAPALGASAASKPPELTEDLLRSSFPLIRRVELEVHLSREIWDVSRVRGANQFVLVDLPGLGAAHSTFRDRYICARELKTVHTALLLLDSRLPGGDAPDRLLNMIFGSGVGAMRGRVLVGIGRFDLLPLGGGAGEQQRAFEQLADETASYSLLADDPVRELSDEELFEKLPLLRTTVQNALQLTNNDFDRLAFLSPRRWLQWARQALSTVRVSSPGFNPEPVDGQQLERWQGVVELLRGNGQSKLAPLLENYARDGGIDRLRTIIRRHAATHGLDELVARALPLQERLKVQMGDLLKVIGAGQTGDVATIRTLRENLAKLSQFYDAEKARFQENPPPLVANFEGRGRRSVQEEIDSELRFQVYTWPVWRRIFDCVQENALVRRADFEHDDGGILGEILGVPPGSIPSTSDEFLAPYADMVLQVEKLAHEKIEEALTSWMEELQVKLAPLRAKFLPLLEQKDELIAALGDEDNVPFKVLCTALEPKTLAQKLVQHPRVRPKTLPVLDATRVFPLPRGSNGSPGRLMGWAEQVERFPVEQRPPNAERHQKKILHLRHELSRSASEEFRRFIGTTTESSAYLVYGLASSLIEQISSLMQNGRVLAKISGRLVDSPSQTHRTSSIEPDTRPVKPPLINGGLDAKPQQAPPSVPAVSLGEVSKPTATSFDYL